MQTPTNSSVSHSIRLAIGAVLFGIFLVAISAASSPARAQGPDQATPAATQAANKGHGFVGQVEDSQAFIGLQVTDNEVNVFVCDGTKTSISYWHWFKGQFENGSVKVTAPDGESMTAQLGDDAVTGTVTLHDKKAHNFKAMLASGTAGLVRNEFTIDQVDYVGGWIVLPDGQVRGGVQDKKGKKKPLIVIIAILIG